MIRPLRMVWLGLTIVWFGSVVGPASMRAADGTPVKVSPKEAEKLVISSPSPTMYGGVWQLHFAGRVKLEFTVQEDGSVTDIKELDDLPANAPTRAMIGEPGKDALQDWKFHPYTVDGKPTPMRTTVEFQLKWVNEQPVMKAIFE